MPTFKIADVDTNDDDFEFHASAVEAADEEEAFERYLDALGVDADDEPRALIESPDGTRAIYAAERSWRWLVYRND